MISTEGASAGRKRWSNFVTLRVPLDRLPEAFEHRGGKATLVLSD